MLKLRPAPKWRLGLQVENRQSSYPELLAAGHGFRSTPHRRWLMLKLALTFFLIGLVAVLLGFTGIAGASFAIAKFFAVLFGILFLVFLILGLSATRRIA
jgi:uncharacterized membrane protein YtjA (UPF0391 family)